MAETTIPESTQAYPVQASTPETPKKPTLSEQYEIEGDDTQSVGLDAPPQAVERAAEAPKKPDHLPYIVAEALEQGLTQGEIDSLPPETLTGIVHRNLKMARDMARQQANAATIQTRPQEPAPEPVERDVFEVEVEEEGEKKKYTKKDVHPSILSAVGALEAELKSLKQQLAGVNAREAESNTQLLDRVFSETSDIFGDGSIREITKDSPEYVRRFKIVEMVQQDRSHRSLEQKTRKAIETIYGKQKPAEARTQVAPAAPAVPAAKKPANNGRITEEEWNAASLKRPTQRTGAAEPAGRSKAISAVAAKIDEIGTAEPDSPGITSIDDFPD